MKAKPKRLTEEDLHVHLLPLARRFREAADPVDAAAMSAYMKGHFPFFGIKAPLRRALQKAHWVEVGLPDLEELPGLVRSAFAQPQREWHYAALDLLVKQEKKLGLRHLPLVEELITTKSWWDTVDSLAVHVAGGILRRHPQAAAEWSGRWAESDDLWLQRTAILFQNRWKQHADQALLFAHIDRHAASKEFFLRKAIGWSLRELGATDPAAVLAFVQARKLSPLSEREALRKL
jgi:3-methyladenine DNA glycosylase AlkD